MRFTQHKIVFGIDSTVTSGGTKILLADSDQVQEFTGATTHNLRLPDATTMVNGTGIPFVVLNFSTGAVTIQLDDLSTLTTVDPGQSAEILLTANGTTNGTWRVKTGTSGASGGAGSVSPGAAVMSAARGLWGGGNTGSHSNVIDYLDFTSMTTALDFGDLTVARSEFAAVGSSTRAVWGGGYTGVARNELDYVTIATLGNALTFGTLTTRTQLAGCGNQTRGLFAGGDVTGVENYTNLIEYITIASTGNGTTFGNLTVARQDLQGVSSPIQGIFGGGGFPGSESSVIDYVMIATTANAISWGSLSAGRQRPAACSNALRAVYAGGRQNGPIYLQSIDYFNITATGNAANFGNLVTGKEGACGVSTQTRAFVGGGFNGSHTATIESIVLANLSNAANFGSLSVAKSYIGGTSNAHGGLF